MSDAVASNGQASRDGRKMRRLTLAAGGSAGRRCGSMILPPAGGRRRAEASS
jgi:hypothetical protein